MNLGGEKDTQSIWDRPETNTDSAVAMGGSLSQSRKSSVSSPRKKNSMYVYVNVSLCARA